MEQVDLLIVGSGPGGYVAALRGAQLGAQVMMVEKDEIGGTCLNRGCIPTKTLHKSAELFTEMKKADEFGFQIDNINLDYQRVSDRKEEIVGNLKDSVKKLLKKAGVQTVFGRCELKADKEAEVDLHDGSKMEVKANSVIIATGSESATSDLPGSDHKDVIGTDEILEMRELVDDLVVIGGGVTGVELAGIMSEFGVNVSLVKRTPYISPVDDDIAKRLFSILKRAGVNVMTQSQVKEIREHDGEKSLEVVVEKKGKEQRVPADKVLISRGRKPHLDGLEALDLEIGEDGIQVNEKLETNIPGVYAIGDAASQGAMLAHVAHHQGVLAAENAMGEERTYDDKAVPNCVFTVTEVASVGENEASLKEQEIPYKVGRFPFGANGKALAEGKIDGQVKILSHQETDQVLGVHIMGPHASDLIQEGTVAVKEGLKTADLGELIHPHPTLSETLWEAALDSLDMPLHQLPKKKKK
ncbi:dihydrolipoyl dehydrogenase [Natranaerobius thermophilus]|uniref:Dihydrolipoyl dehydrogenase n=1 Tax=Natranaerobius thermophilus (strain ATCC BAA-1301 / DSM 18059 / JW/NM-WN-LF) TaxID=457570 RepID=B2A2T0_NATTJ|nr:dihydrolipoyl dehydrogenase [Natranaerobius thermophilus]ACB86298.1 dihydrolipoamide dehydrogenase [Natranaerobius thermophilus JW/NM-WN-LF]